MQREGNMGPEIHWNVNQNQQTTTCWMEGTHLVSIGFSQQHPHTWIHTYYKTPLISVSLTHFEGKTEIPGDTGLSHRTFGISCGRNIFPKEIVFLLWHCWRCTICKRKSENLHSRGERLGWRWDESGALLSQILGEGGIRGWPLCWENDWEQHRARGAEWHPTKHCVTARAPNAGPDPDRSSASEIPGQTHMLRNRTARML